MAEPHPIELREAVVRAVLKEGLTRHEAAARFGVSPSSAIKWVTRYRKYGSVAPGKRGQEVR